MIIKRDFIRQKVGPKDRKKVKNPIMANREIKKETFKTPNKTEK